MIRTPVQTIRQITEHVKLTSVALRNKRLLKEQALRRLTEIKRLKRVRIDSTAPFTYCTNCGEELRGMYCHRCGQFAAEATETLPRFIKHYMDNNFSYDGRLWITLKYLFLRPGFLPQEYKKGRITSYMHPLKLYMFTSFVFFFLFFTLTLSNNKLINMEGNSNSISVNMDDTNSDHTGKSEKKIDLNKFRDIASGHFKTYSPLAMFLLMPFFGLLLKAVYRRNKISYVNHLVFSINFHTILLILFSMAIITDYVSNKTYPEISNHTTNVLLSGIIIYFLIASKKFYNLGWKKIILKTTLISFLYSILIFTLLVAFLSFEIIQTYKLA